ncbi:hypothetical protein [Streptococcus equinus]|nr:hypothetical protein [Streptococcus equinus]QBX15877.1 hypothetical protein Javan221_0019 [Streptococcus phage Javan221]SEI63883.1 hypothetical protein SAMN05216423_0911 [Streptococcus equinus]
MAEYVHSRTGAVIATDSVLSGAWEPVKNNSKQKKSKKKVEEKEAAE